MLFHDFCVTGEGGLCPPLKSSKCGSCREDDGLEGPAFHAWVCNCCFKLASCLEGFFELCVMLFPHIHYDNFARATWNSSILTSPEISSALLVLLHILIYRSHLFPECVLFLLPVLFSSSLFPQARWTFCLLLSLETWALGSRKSYFGSVLHFAFLSPPCPRWTGL